MSGTLKLGFCGKAKDTKFLLKNASSLLAKNHPFDFPVAFDAIVMPVSANLRQLVRKQPPDIEPTSVRDRN